MNDDDLIRKHISRQSGDSPDDARLKEFGQHMWALAGCVAIEEDVTDPVAMMMETYGISNEAGVAAWVYITRWRKYIDARLLLNNSYFYPVDDGLNDT